MDYYELANAAFRWVVLALILYVLTSVKPTSYGGRSVLELIFYELGIYVNLPWPF